MEFNLKAPLVMNAGQYSFSSVSLLKNALIYLERPEGAQIVACCEQVLPPELEYLYLMIGRLLESYWAHAKKEEPVRVQSEIETITNDIERALEMLEVKKGNGSPEIDNLNILDKLFEEFEGINQCNIQSAKRLFTAFCNMRIAAFKCLEKLAYEVIAEQNAYNIIDFDPEHDERAASYKLVKQGVNPAVNELFLAIFYNHPLDNEVFAKSAEAIASLFIYYADYLSGKRVALETLEPCLGNTLNGDNLYKELMQLLSDTVNVFPVIKDPQGHGLN